MHHGIQRQIFTCVRVCSPIILFVQNVSVFFFLSGTFQLFGTQRGGVITARWGVFSPRILPLKDCTSKKTKTKTHTHTNTNERPLLLCCPSDLTAAKHCSCVSPLEYVFSKCKPQVAFVPVFFVYFCLFVYNFLNVYAFYAAPTPAVNVLKNS